jgi:hypothetical protein
MGYDLYVFASDFDDTSEPEELAECDIGDFCDLAFSTVPSSVTWALGGTRP